MWVQQGVFQIVLMAVMEPNAQRSPVSVVFYEQGSYEVWSLSGPRWEKFTKAATKEEGECQS